MSANMGGTNIYDPLEWVFVRSKTTQEKIKYAKKVFLLTDGAVSNPQNVIELIKKFNKDAVVHTFGIGAGASEYLVRESARAGKGTFSFIAEDSNLKAKVIEALQRCLEPCYQDVTIQWSNPLSVLFDAPSGAQIGQIYRHQVFNYYAVL